MDVGSAREIGHLDLAVHGVRFRDHATVRVRERASGEITLATLRGTAASEFLVDTATSHPDHVLFAFIDAPAVWSKLGDEPWLEIEERVVIAPLGLDHVVHCRGPWRITAALVPRTAVATFVPQLAAGLHLYSERRVLDLAMDAFLTELVDAQSRTSAIERYAIEQLVLEMSGALLLDRLGSVAAQGPPRVVLRDRALAVIAQQCGDPALTPAQVAREVQSSLRQLQLVFAEADTSVAAEIRRHRARLARTLLLDSRYDVLSVDQIALRAGFHSSVSLRRALDDAFDTTPRALRSGRRP